MLRLSPEAKVGVFVLFGLLLLVYMSLKVGGIKFGRGEGYDVIVRFDNVAGLDKDAPVRVAGVEIGRVKDIRLQDHKARVILKINPDVKLGKDFTAVIKTQGLLGEKYVSLIPGSPQAPPVEPGGEITRTTTYEDFDKLIARLSGVTRDIKEITSTLSRVLGGTRGEKSLRNIVMNLEKVTKDLDKVVIQNSNKIDRMMSNFEEFSKVLRDNSPQLIHNLTVLTKNMNELIEENRGSLKESLENLRAATGRLEETLTSITEFTKEIQPKLEGTFSSIQKVSEKIEKGEGTIGKLVNDETTVKKLNETLEGVNKLVKQGERFKTFIGVRGEYLFDASTSKNFVTLRLQPRKDKYYLFEIIEDPKNRVQFDRQGMREPADKVRYSAEIARRFQDLTLRAGLIESQGGIGIDYHLFDDRLKFTFEASDFDRDRNPFLKLGATYHLNKYFFLTGGYSDIISRQGLESAYIGLGFQFEDEDLKYLLTNAPISAP